MLGPRGLGVLALLGAACSSRVPRPAREAPLELDGPVAVALGEGGMPVVRLVVDGHADLPFLVDSGSATTLLDAACARELGLPARRCQAATRATGSGGRSLVIDRCATIARAELGGLVLRDFCLPLLEDEVLRPSGWVGILGQDVLGRLPVVLDMERRTLHLLRPDDGPEGIQSYLAEVGLAGAWTVVEAAFRPSPVLPLDVAGLAPGSVEIEVDTGSSSTSFPARVLEALDVEPTGTAEFRAVGGTHDEQVYFLEGFGLYGFRIAAEVHASPLDYGLLGMNVLAEFVVILDGPRQQIWLHHRTPPAAGESAAASAR